MRVWVRVLGTRCVVRIEITGMTKGTGGMKSEYMNAGMGTDMGNGTGTEAGTVLGYDGARYVVRVGVTGASIVGTDMSNGTGTETGTVLGYDGAKCVWYE